MRNIDLDLIRDWVEDLRTTDAKQAKGVLNDGKGGYCCLGRLCELIDPDSWSPTPTGVGWGPGADEGMPPFPEVRTPIAKLMPGRDITLTTYSIMNDDGATFAEIADRIEQDFGLA